MSPSQRVHEVTPISPAATIGVMPPVSRMVDDSRFTEFSTSMIARASGAPGGTRPSASAWS
jgi:ATP-dependent phosphoenolpyruvate carboxykinase